MDDETVENVPVGDGSRSEGAQPEQAVTTGDVGGKSTATCGRSVWCSNVLLHLALI